MSAPEVTSAEPRHTGAQPADIAVAAQDGTDWEYEYDDNETEDYYFTLDLTTQQPNRAQNRRPRTKRRRLTGPDHNAATDVSFAKDNVESTSNPTTAQPDNSGKLQVLDLHSQNPLVLLDGQLYSCQWSTDLGTQFYVARPDKSEKRLRAGRVVDVVGLSRARLVGSPVIAHPRRKQKDVTSVGETAAHAIAIADDEDGVENEEDSALIASPTEEDASLQDELSTAARFTKARREAKDPKAKARISFLERLSAIKQKKGETDQIPLAGVKDYEPPSNQDEIRRASLAADAERKKAEGSTSAKTRKRGPDKKTQSPAAEDDSLYAEQKRRKPGPKTSTEVKSSLGLSGGNG